MKNLVRALAHLCSLRDRHALDAALVDLVVQVGAPRVQAARLLKLVGDPADLRCLLRAERLASRPGHERLPAWVDWRELPPLTDFAARAQAHAEACRVAQDGPPALTVTPMGHGPVHDCFLELELSGPLGTELQEMVDGVVQLYQNFEGLLDYGEKDALTELLNRKTFDTTFAKAATEQSVLDADAPADRRQFRAEESYWLAVLDIDHFKRVNDNFGHLIGDEVLLLMARLMRTSFRFHDQLYRFGGEEFVVLMRCAGLADASNALERFRRKVEGYAFPQVGHITVSIGFAALRSDDTPGGAFDRADKAVYHAKAHGRNQVVSYQNLLRQGVVVEEAKDAKDIDFF